MRTTLIMLIGLLFSASVIQAQNSLPDPADLFESSVKIMATEPIIHVVAPSVHWDDDRREVTVLVADGTKHYPYPDELISLAEQFSPVWHDQLVLSGYTETSEVGFWPFVLNLQTGTFLRYQPQCGTNSPTDLDRNLRNDLWVVEMTSTGIDLCASLTGEHIPLPDLPKDFVPLPLTSLSPDFNDLIFLSKAGDIYNYTFASAKMIHLGRVAPDDQPTINSWIDNQHIILNLHQSDQCAAYVADVTQADGHPLQTDTFPNCARLSSHPTQIVFNQSTYSDDGDLLNTCAETIYDIQTGARQFNDFKNFCDPDYGLAENVAYYRVVADDLRTVDVVRFNPQTDEQKTLYTHTDVEWVVWVSADEHFAVLLLDDDQYIDRLPGSTLAYIGWGIQEPKLALVDLQSGKIRYQVIIPWDSELSSAVFSDMTMLRDDLLLVQLRDLSVETLANTDVWMTSPHDLGAQLVQLTDLDSLITPVGEVAVIPRDHTHLFIWTDGKDVSTALHVYDIATGKMTPLLRAVDQTKFSVSIAGGETPDTALVTVYPVVDGIVDYGSGIRYTVQF